MIHPIVKKGEGEWWVPEAKSVGRGEVVALEVIYRSLTKRAAATTITHTAFPSDPMRLLQRLRSNVYSWWSVCQDTCGFPERGLARVAGRGLKWAVEGEGAADSVIR